MNKRGRYIRFSDAEDDVNRVNEVYEQLIDQSTGEPIRAQNISDFDGTV